jgi:hypothetical protein
VHARRATRSAYSRVISELNPVFFIDNSNRMSDLRDFAQSVNFITKEAAAIRVLVENFKALG